jgi:hypothetical protein
MVTRRDALRPVTTSATHFVSYPEPARQDADQNHLRVRLLIHLKRVSTCGIRQRLDAAPNFVQLHPSMFKMTQRLIRS